jgi:hypothetical protein
MSYRQRTAAALWPNAIVLLFAALAIPAVAQIAQPSNKWIPDTVTATAPTNQCGYWITTQSGGYCACWHWVTTQYGGYCAASPVELTAAQQQEAINTQLAVQAEYQRQLLQQQAEYQQQQAVPAASDETPARPAKHHGFKNAMINALHGAGQSMQQYAQQPHQTVTCTTQQLGNTAYTTCQ